MISLALTSCPAHSLFDALTTAEVCSPHWELQSYMWSSFALFLYGGNLYISTAAGANYLHIEVWMIDRRGVDKTYSSSMLIISNLHQLDGSISGVYWQTDCACKLFYLISLFFLSFLYRNLYGITLKYVPMMFKKSVKAQDYLVAALSPEGPDSGVLQCITGGLFASFPFVHV